MDGQESPNEALFTELRTIGAELDALRARQEVLYARRLAIWIALTERDGVTQRDMAEAAGTTEGAVTQALRKHRLATG